MSRQKVVDQAGFIPKVQDGLDGLFEIFVVEHGENRRVYIIEDINNPSSYIDIEAITGRQVTYSNEGFSNATGTDMIFFAELIKYARLFALKYLVDNRGKVKPKEG